MAQKCSYFSPMYNTKFLGNSMIHFETKTCNELLIANKAYKQVQKIFSIKFCQWKQQTKTSVFVAQKPIGDSNTNPDQGGPSIILYLFSVYGAFGLTAAA